MGHPSAGDMGKLWTEQPVKSTRFVVLHSGGSVPPHGGWTYGSGYLPANNQGSILQVDLDEPIQNIRPSESLSAQRKRLNFKIYLIVNS